MKCPNCHGNMTATPYESVTIDVCERCGGAWLDDGEISSIVKDKTQTFSESLKLSSVDAKGQDRRDAKALSCPKCNAPMLINQYAYGSGVFIDRCPQKHGIWLDANELERIQIVMDEIDLRSTPSKSVAAPISQVLVKNCPVDGTRMNHIAYEGERLDKCPKCEGVWCDEGELQKIVAQKTQAMPGHHGAGLHSHENNPKVSAPHELASHLNCVICQRPMLKVNYSYSSGVVLDRCRSGHGIWLDKEELEKIQAFAEAWSKKSPELDVRYSLLLQKASLDIETRMDRAAKEGQTAALRGTFAGKVIRKIFGS
jgi:Zn-finger nucleic acid-binding protein